MSIKTFHSWLVVRGALQPSGASKGRKLSAAATVFRSLLQKKLLQRSIAASSQQPVVPGSHTPSATSVPSIPPLQSPSTFPPKGDRSANAPSTPPASATSTDTSPSFPANTNQSGSQIHTIASDASQRLSPRIQSSGAATPLSPSPQDSAIAVPKHPAQNTQTSSVTVPQNPSLLSPRDTNRAIEKPSDARSFSPDSLLYSPSSSTSSIIPAHSPKLATAPTATSAAPAVVPSLFVPTELLRSTIDGSELQKHFTSPDHTLTLTQKPLDQPLLIALTRTVPIGIQATVSTNSVPGQHSSPNSSPRRQSFLLPFTSSNSPSAQRWRPLTDLLHLLQRYQATDVEILFVNPVSQRTILVKAPSVSQVEQTLKSLSAGASTVSSFSAPRPAPLALHSQQAVNSHHIAIFSPSSAISQHPATSHSASPDLRDVPSRRANHPLLQSAAARLLRQHRPELFGTSWKRTFLANRLLQQQQTDFPLAIPPQPVAQPAHRGNANQWYPSQRFKGSIVPQRSNRTPHFRTPASLKFRRGHYLRTPEEFRPPAPSQRSIAQPLPSHSSRASRRLPTANPFSQKRNKPGLSTTRIAAAPIPTDNHLSTAPKVSPNHTRASLRFNHKISGSPRSLSRPGLQHHRTHLDPAPLPPIQSTSSPAAHLLRSDASATEQFFAIPTRRAMPTPHQGMHRQRRRQLPSSPETLSIYPRFSRSLANPYHSVSTIQPSRSIVETTSAHQQRGQQEIISAQTPTDSPGFLGTAHQQPRTQHVLLRHFLRTSQLPSTGSPARPYGAKNLLTAPQPLSPAVFATRQRIERIEKTLQDHVPSVAFTTRQRSQQQDHRTRAVHRLQVSRRSNFTPETRQKLRSSHLPPGSRLQTLATRKLSAEATAPEPASRSQAEKSLFLTTTTRNNLSDRRNLILAGRKEAATAARRHQFLPASPKTPAKSTASPSPTFGQLGDRSSDSTPNASTPATTIAIPKGRSHPLHTHPQERRHFSNSSRQLLHQQRAVRLSPELLPAAMENRPNASNGKAQQTYFSSAETLPVQRLQPSSNQRHTAASLRTPPPPSANVQRQLRASIPSRTQVRFDRHNGENLLDAQPTPLRANPLIVRPPQGDIQHSKAPSSNTPVSRVWTESPVSAPPRHSPLTSLQSAAIGSPAIPAARSFALALKHRSVPIQSTQQSGKTGSRHHERPGAPITTAGSKRPDNLPLSGAQTTANKLPLHPAPIRRRQPSFSHLLPSFKKQPHASSPDTPESSSIHRIPIRPVSSSLKKLLSHATSERMQPLPTQILNPATRSQPTISLKNVTQSHTPPPSVRSPQPETDGAQQSPVANRIPPRWNGSKIRPQAGHKRTQSLLQTGQVLRAQDRSHSAQHPPLSRGVSANSVQNTVSMPHPNTAAIQSPDLHSAAQPALYRLSAPIRTTAQAPLSSSEQHVISRTLYPHTPSLETTEQRKTQKSFASDFLRFHRTQGKKVKKSSVVLHRAISHHLRSPSASAIVAISRLSSHPRPVLNHHPAALPARLLRQQSVLLTSKRPRLPNGSLGLSVSPLHYVQSRQSQSLPADYIRALHIFRNRVEKPSIHQVPLSQTSPESSSLLQRSSHTLRRPLTVSSPRLYQPGQILSTKIIRFPASPSLRLHHQVLLRSTPTSSASSTSGRENPSDLSASVTFFSETQRNSNAATFDAIPQQPILPEKAPFSTGVAFQARLHSTPGSERALPTVSTYAPGNGQRLRPNRVNTGENAAPSIPNNGQRLRPNRDVHTGKALQQSRQPLTSSAAQASKQAKVAGPSSIPKTVPPQNKAGSTQKSSHRRSASMAVLRQAAIDIGKQIISRTARRSDTIQQPSITDRSFRQITETQPAAPHLTTSAALNRAENEARPLPSTSPLEHRSPSPEPSSLTGSTLSASPRSSIHRLAIQPPAATITYRPPTVTTASSAQSAMRIAPSTPVLSISSPSITITDPFTSTGEKPAEGMQQGKLHFSPSSPADIPVAPTVVTSPPSPSIRTPNSPYPNHFPATASRTVRQSHRGNNANSQGNHQQASHSFQRQPNTAGVTPPLITGSFAEASETALQDLSLQPTEDLSATDITAQARMVTHTGESLPAGTPMPTPASSLPIRVPMAQLPSLLAAFIAGAKQRNIPTSRVRFTLQPENLGSVEIAITITGNQVTLRMLVEKSSVKETFEKRLPLLREALATHRLSLQDVTVQVATDDHRTILEHSLQQQMAHSGNQQYESQREYLEMLSTLYELSQQVDQQV